MGKSTFAREFCRWWERGEIAQQYQLVLVLRLREERISNAESLEDLIYHPLKDVHQAVCHELVLAHDFHALIILEGFDELPDSCRKGGSVFMDLIAGKLLPLATVLVTSRPWATLGIRRNSNRIYQHIEILGFTGRQITEYIESTLPQDKASDLKAYLESHPQIRAGMYIPLNSAIVVTVYDESQTSGCAMPTTLTELYTSVTLTLLLRYLHGHPEYGADDQFLDNFNDLPFPAYKNFCKLCTLAYNGTVGTSDQVQLIYSGLHSDFDDLGFMDSVTELYVTRGAVSSHNFLHLTFQEFFAAVHISNMSPEEQVEHFKRHEEGRLKVVLRFVAGLNKLNCFSIEEIANNFFQTPSTHEGSRYLISCDAAVGIDLVQWLFEAQSDNVIEHVLGQKTIEFELPSGMLPLDYYSLGYCISHSQCQCVLGLGKVKIDETGAKMLATGAARNGTGGSIVGLKEGTTSYLINVLLAESKSIVCQQKISLKLSGQCESHLITWPDLSALRVLELIISGKTDWKLNTLLPHLSLESLTIVPASDNMYSALVFGDCKDIGGHITSTTCLKELCILSDISDEKGVEAITAALARNQSLPLERLELESKCTFTATAVDSLVQFITNTTTLKYFSIKKGTFDGVETVTAALASNQSLPLERLELEFEYTFTTTAQLETCSVAQFITNTNTQSVEKADFDGVQAITAALASNHSLPLERLELEFEYTFTTTAVDSLAQFIINTTTLKYLSIKKFTFSAHGLLVLARTIHHNSILQTKNVAEFILTVNGDNEAKDLAQLLVKYPDLMNANYRGTGLYLSNNSISDAGAVALAKTLRHNSTLTQMDLSGNDGIGKQGIRQLVQALTVNTSVIKYGGLCLHRRCETYAKQCPQYHTVEDRIAFYPQVQQYSTLT